MTMTFDERAEAIGWRRGEGRDWQFHDLKGDSSSPRLWVRIDGLRWGWCFTARVDDELIETLGFCNEHLEQQQAIVPYSFLPDDEIVPATSDGSKGHSWIAAHHAGESLADIWRVAREAYLWSHDEMGRAYYAISSALGLPKDGQEHVPFCTLPPDHPPGCGVTASGAMHPESDAAKRYREMRGGASQEKPGNQSNGWRR